jgi:sirohydrochlorin cobaltochelatase
MDMSKIGLLLVGHGASSGGGGAVRRLAQRLAAQGRFSEVAACFWKESPSVEEGLGLVKSPVVLVVPVFATEGRIARELIPARLGLSGEVSRVIDGRTLHYLRPVGVHPALAELADERARRAASIAEFEIKRTGLLLIAHGNRQGVGARASAEALADKLRAKGDWQEVTALFLEEEPKAAAWRERTKSLDMVVLPLLLAQGQHAARDVAPLFGLQEMPDGDVQRLTFEGRRLALMRGLADDQALAGIILQMCEEALSRPSPR